MDSLRPTKHSTQPPPQPPRGVFRQPINLGYASPSSQTSTLPSTPTRRFLKLSPLILGLCFILISIGVTLFLFLKIVHVSHRLSFESSYTSSFFTEITDTARSLFSKSEQLKQTATGRINILLLGRAGEHYPGKNLTDTIILASIDMKTHRVALLSFPRDLYAPIGRSDTYTKINAIYQIGLDTQDGVALLRDTIETLTGEPVHYSVIVDFDGFEKIIDTIGGISVDVPRDIRDTRYPGKNYSYETFEIKKGWRKLDGATALKYVRERHDDPEGDFGRARRQQQVLQAVRDKVFSTGTLLNIFTLSHLLDVLGESIKTDITPSEIEGFLSLLRLLDTKNITTAIVDAWKPESILRVSHIPTPNGNAFILIPRTGNWKEVTALAQHIFTLDDLKKERARVENEHASLHIVATEHQKVLADTLRHFLTKELGFETTSLQISHLESAPKQSTLHNMTEGQKPYSHNALLSRFDFDQDARSLPESYSLMQYPTPQPDFILRIGEDLETSDLLGETGATPEANNDEVITPQKRTKKK